MKTRHIIAIGLLSALAVAVLGLAIHTGKAKAKTLQTKADYNITEISLPQDANISKQVNFNIYGEKTIKISEPNANMAISYYYSLHYTKTGNTPTNTLTQTIDIDNIDTTTNTYSPDLSTPITFTIDGEIIIDKYTIETHVIEIANNTFYNEVHITTYYTINYEDYYHEEIFQFREPVNETNFENNLDYPIDDIPVRYTINTIYNTLNQYANGSYAEGYGEGYNDGISEGSATGYQNGYNAGYGIGYNDSEAFNHPIALQPLMLNILTMPFTFISQAFDVTLWPGTAYEFNFANFIKGIIAIATIMFIIKLFTSGFSIIGNYTSNIRNESNMRSAQRQKNRASKIHKPSKNKKE